MLGQRGLGHPPSFSPLTSDRGPWPLGCCSVETAPFSTSTPNRPQLRPRPRGKRPSGAEPGKAPRHVGTHSPRPAPSWGSTTGGQEDLGQAGQGYGPCWILPLACGASEQNRPSPAGDLPGCFQRPVCKHSCRLFPQAAHSAPKSGRKALWGGPLSGPLALSLGTS